MQRSTRVIVSVSSGLFIGSFMLSIQSNIWSDALYRSVLVFVVSALGMYAFYRLWEYIQTQAQDQRGHNVGQEKSGDNDEGKGEQVDVATPDDGFVPWEHEDRANANGK